MDLHRTFQIQISSKMSLIYGIAGRYHITVPVAAYNIINTTQQLFYSIIVICKTSVIIISITRRNRAYITSA